MASKLTLRGRVRTAVQALTTLGYNANFKGFFSGNIYKGPLKQLCVPGLNCYSCPGALGSCPIGALQAVAGSPAYSVSLAVIGFLMVVGALVGRFVCGFLCPFGFFQDLLHKLPVKKRSTKKLHALKLLKYAVLLVFVILLPALAVNKYGIGSPYFCKWLCPQGVLEGALPLFAVNPQLSGMAGPLFLWKAGLLLAVVVGSAVVFRPFCKFLCPLGAIYGIFNRFSLLRLHVDEHRCVKCGACEAVCKMDIAPNITPNSPECIRCGDCISACPHSALAHSGPGSAMKQCGRA